MEANGVRAHGDSIISRVRSGQSLKIPAERAAPIVGINKRVYRLVDRMLVLKDRGVLNERDLKLVDEAIEEINSGKRLERAFDLVSDVLRRHWMPKTMNGTNEKERRRQKKLRNQFDRTVFLIRETCTNNDEMEIPVLNSKEKTEAIVTLNESLAGIVEFISKIRRESE